jgi:hypothetical protein
MAILRKGPYFWVPGQGPYELGLRKEASHLADAVEASPGVGGGAGGDGHQVQEPHRVQPASCVYGSRSCHRKRNNSRVDFLRLFVIY